MGVLINADTDTLTRSGGPAATGLTDYTIWGWHRRTSGVGFAATQQKDIFTQEGNAGRANALGFDNTFVAALESDARLHLHDAGVSTDFDASTDDHPPFDTWIFYVIVASGAAGSVTLTGYWSAEGSSTWHTKAASMVGTEDSITPQTLIFGASYGDYAYCGARAEALNDTNAKLLKDRTATAAGDWGYWRLADSSDTADTSGNSRTLTFNGSIGNGADPSLSSGGSDIAPALLTNAQTFYAPTVGRGAVGLTPSLFTNAQTFYAPTVGRGAVNLSPALLTNAQAFYAPTVAPGAVALTPGLLANSQTFYGPTVSGGSVALAPGLLANSQTFYGPTVAPGAASVTAPLLTNTQTFPAPTVSATASVTAPLLTNSQTFPAPTVSGSGSLAVPLFTNTQTFYAPIVAPGAVAVASPLLSNSQTVYAPSVASIAGAAPPLLTNVSTFPALAVAATNGLVVPQLVNLSTFFAPVVASFGANDVTLTATRLSNTQTFPQSAIFTRSNESPSLDYFAPLSPRIGNRIVKSARVPRFGGKNG